MKTVCWKDTTKFSVLETGQPAKPSDIRKGSYLRIEGAEKDGKFQATEIVTRPTVMRASVEHDSASDVMR